jgi:hypothetical protein
MTNEEIAAEIHDAFRGVTREGGMSWRDAEIADFWGDESKASYIDTDRCWKDLVDDLDWSPEVGIGGWSFLEAIGFRYYLPAAMLRALDGSDGITFHLTLPKENDELHGYCLSHFLAFSDAQLRCVAHFLCFMDEKAYADAEALENSNWRHADLMHLKENSTPWRTAYDSYWSQFDDLGIT